MAIDIALIPDETGIYDIAFENGDFQLVNSFDTSLIISLFADARATASQVPQSQLRRGWWGNRLGLRGEGSRQPQRSGKGAAIKLRQVR